MVGNEGDVAFAVDGAVRFGSVVGIDGGPLRVVEFQRYDADIIETQSNIGSSVGKIGH